MVDPFQHVQGPCNCGEEHKGESIDGDDLYWQINVSDIECFNQASQNGIKSVIRPYDLKMAHTVKTTLGTESDYGPELVVNIPFKGDVRVKSFCVIGGPNGTAPSSVKLYKNETAVDADIINDKKPLQEFKITENESGAIEYPVKPTLFASLSSLVFGFDENFGAETTQVKFIGIKGEFLKGKAKLGKVAYEIRAVPDENDKIKDFTQMGHQLGL